MDVSDVLTLMLSAGALVVITVFIHALGFAALLRVVLRSQALERFGFRATTAWVMTMTFWLILIHFVEISVWGVFYLRQGCLPDAESAVYFSASTYTSAGYGDLVLPKPWRMLGPIETLTGILMTGASSGLFFALVIQRIRNFRASYLESRGAHPRTRTSG